MTAGEQNSRSLWLRPRVAKISTGSFGRAEDFAAEQSGSHREQCTEGTGPLMEWQTCRFQTPVPQGVWVQVPRGLRPLEGGLQSSHPIMSDRSGAVDKSYKVEAAERVG